MRVDGLDGPTGEFVVRAPPYVTTRGPNRALPANTCTSDYLAASVFAVPVAPFLPAPTEGTDPGRRAISSEPYSVPVSSTADPGNAARETLPPAQPVYHDLAEHPTDSGPQEPSAVSHSASRVARTNRDQVSVVPAASPLLPSSSQTALPSLPPSGLISSRIRRRQAAAAGKPTTAVDYGFARSHPTPPTVPRPAPTARKPRPPRTTSPSEDYPRLFIDPVPTVPIRPTTGAVTPAPLWLGTLPLEAPRRPSTTAALPEIPSLAEIELIESVE